MSVPDLETYRRRAEEFIGALDSEYYQHFSGRKPVCDTAAVYDRYPELFTREAVDELEALYQRTVEDDAKRRLAYLIAFTVDGFMGEQTKHLVDEIANTEGSTTIEVDGETIGLRQAGVVQGNEADAARRARIQDARLAATDEHLNPLLDASLAALSRSRRRPRLPQLHGALLRGQGSRLRPAARRARGLPPRHRRPLRARHGPPGPSSAWASRSPSSPTPTCRTCGGPPASTTSSPPTASCPRSATRSPGMHIDLDAQTNVHLDTEVRELKSPRAFCAPVRVPDEIYLVVLPHGGQDDYAALLHEAGHTEHFAHTSPELPFEYRHLGDNAVTEAFAFIFDHLVVNRRWLRSLSASSRTPTTSCASPASTISTSCAATPPSWLYETELHAQTGELRGMPAEYSRRLSEATMVEVPEQMYLVDVDDGFYCASYLRAWMLEGALRMMLQDRYGMEWFARRRRRRVAQGALVQRPALHRRAAAAQARRRPSRHRPPAAPLRARPGPLRPGRGSRRQRAASTLTSTRRRRGPSNSAK